MTKTVYRLHLTPRNRFMQSKVDYILILSPLSFMCHMIEKHFFALIYLRFTGADSGYPHGIFLYHREVRSTLL